MEKRKESRVEGLMKLALAVVCLIGILMYMNTDNFAKYGWGKKLYKVAEVDSLKSENAALRQALSEKLISHCDTMSVDQKLAQQKFDEYESKMYKIKEAQTSKASSQKEAAVSKALKAKDDNNVGWDAYSKKKNQAVLKLEKTDSKIFASYAVVLFKDHECSYDSYEFNRAIYECREQLEKSASVAEYLKTVKTAEAIRSKFDKELDDKYRSQKTEIEKKYQSQIAAIEKNYNQKITAKKAELGL